jgi:hypothetical protein
MDSSGSWMDQMLKKIFTGDMRYYFDVDNSYVKKKLLIVLFPFLFKVVKKN